MSQRPANLILSNRLLLLAVMAFVICTVINTAPAQVIYEPIQYQYGDQNKFYYGGTDPHVFERAAAPADAGAQWGRSGGYDFSSGDVWVHREVSDQPVRVYSDALPTQNAALYGFTATDAANVANASVPRYFRKADVLASAGQKPGLLIIPARAVFPPSPEKSAADPAPTTQPIGQPMMILPLPATPPNRATASDKVAMISH